MALPQGFSLERSGCSLTSRPACSPRRWAVGRGGVNALPVPPEGETWWPPVFTHISFICQHTRKPFPAGKLLAAASPTSGAAHLHPCSSSWANVPSQLQTIPASKGSKPSAVILCKLTAGIKWHGHSQPWGPWFPPPPRRTWAAMPGVRPREINACFNADRFVYSKHYANMSQSFITMSLLIHIHKMTQF